MSQSFIEFQCSVWHPNWNRNSMKSWNYELQMENHIKCRNGGITWNSCRWMVKAPEKNIKRKKRISPSNAISATFLNHSQRFFLFCSANMFGSLFRREWWKSFDLMSLNKTGKVKRDYFSFEFSSADMLAGWKSEKTNHIIVEEIWLLLFSCYASFFRLLLLLLSGVVMDLNCKGFCRGIQIPK